jgi:hypothetical protein
MCNKQIYIDKLNYILDNYNHVDDIYINEYSYGYNELMLKISLCNYSWNFVYCNFEYKNIDIKIQRFLLSREKHKIMLGLNMLFYVK